MGFASNTAPCTCGHPSTSSNGSWSSDDVESASPQPGSSLAGRSSSGHAGSSTSSRRELCNSTGRDHATFGTLHPIRSLEIPPTEGVLAQVAKPLRILRTRRSPKSSAPEGCGASTDVVECQCETGAGATTSTLVEPVVATDADEIEKADSKTEVWIEEEWTYPDGGWRAWSVVFACWIFAASQLAYGMMWGALVPNLQANHYPDTPLSTLNLIMGTCALFINGFAFVSGRLGDKFGYRPIIAIGSVLYIVFLVASAFSVNSLPLLFVFQGAGLGIAVGCAFPLVCALPSQWFLKRRGLATGIAVSGTGFGGAVGSLIVRAILPTLGFKRMLLVYAGINAFTTSIAFLLIRVREPPRRPGEPRVTKNWLPKGVWKDGAFYSFALCVFVGIWGYLIPYVFLVTYTIKEVPNVGDGIKPAAPLILANAAGGVGRICAGLLADRFGPVNMLFASFFFGGVLQLVFWPFAHTFGSIMGFGLLYGFTGAWFISLLPVAAAQLFGMKGLATITGFMILVNSPGQFAGGTVGGLILTAAGGSYQGVAFFGGATMVTGALFLTYGQ